MVPWPTEFVESATHVFADVAVHNLPYLVRPAEDGSPPVEGTFDRFVWDKGLQYTDRGPQRVEDAPHIWPASFITLLKGSIRDHEILPGMFWSVSPSPLHRFRTAAIITRSVFVRLICSAIRTTPSSIPAANGLALMRPPETITTSPTPISPAARADARSASASSSLSPAPEALSLAPTKPPAKARSTHKRGNKRGVKRAPGGFKIGTKECTPQEHAYFAVLRTHYRKLRRSIVNGQAVVRIPDGMIAYTARAKRVCGLCRCDRYMQRSH